MHPLQSGINVGVVCWSFLSMMLLEPKDVYMALNPALQGNVTVRAVSNVHNFVELANDYPKALVETYNNMARQSPEVRRCKLTSA